MQIADVDGRCFPSESTSISWIHDAGLRALKQQILLEFSHRGNRSHRQFPGQAAQGHTSLRHDDEENSQLQARTILDSRGIPVGILVY